MPYNIKDKLARRGFWFIFEKNEQPTVKEVYTFDAKVTVKDEKKPLLTLDSKNREHTFWYKTITTSGNGKYKRVPTGGLDIDDLPCIVAFHADLPPDREVTATARATDWKDKSTPPANKLNEQEFKDIAKTRLTFVAARSTSNKALVDVPIMPPVPMVSVVCKNQFVKPSDPAHVHEAYVQDWTGRLESLSVNGVRVARTSKVDLKTLGYGKGDDPVPPILLKITGPIRITPGHPRVEIRASNGLYQGAAREWFTAIPKKGTSPKKPNAPMYGLKGFNICWSATHGLFREWLPFRPDTDRYLVRLRLLGEPVVTSKDTAPSDKITVTVDSQEIDLTAKAKTKIEVQLPTASSQTTTSQPTNSAYVWIMEYESTPLLFIERVPGRKGSCPDPRKQVRWGSVGEVLKGVISTKSRIRQSAALDISAKALGAGFTEHPVTRFRSIFASRNSRPLRLRCHVWSAEKILLKRAKGHIPGVKVTWPRQRLDIPCADEKSIAFSLSVLQGYSSEDLHLRMYGCEQFHPVRVWKTASAPTAKHYPDPYMALPCSQMIDRFHRSATPPKNDNVLTDPWFLCYAIYLTGHDRGYRLEHPSPDNILVLFEGWPGAIPLFEFEDKLNGVVRANYSFTGGVGSDLNRHGAAAFKAAWGRYKNDWILGVAGGITRRVLRGQRTIVKNSWHPYSPMLAKRDLLQLLAQDADIESVSIGGYSIGTNRALYLSQLMANDPTKEFREATGGRPVCVNHLLLIDFNFGACKFIPHTRDLTVPSIARRVHHLMSTGRFWRGKWHYGPPKIRPRWDDMWDLFPWERLGHDHQLPALMTEHTANLWKVWNDLGLKEKTFPELLEELKAKFVSGDLSDLISDETRRKLQEIDHATGEMIDDALWDQIWKDIRERLPVELLIKIFELILRGQIREVIGIIATRLLQLYNVILAVDKLVAFINNLLNMPDALMMFCFGEDGVSNSTGAETIFRVSGGRGPTLIPMVSDFWFLNTDHLGLGAGKAGVCRIARQLLDGRTPSETGRTK